MFFKNVHLPKLQKGGINALIAAVWIEPKYDDDPAGRMYQLLENGFADFCQLDNVVFSCEKRQGAQSCS
jgi:hypothetical protein